MILTGKQKAADINLHSYVVAASRRSVQAGRMIARNLPSCSVRPLVWVDGAGGYGLYFAEMIKGILPSLIKTNVRQENIEVLRLDANPDILNWDYFGRHLTQELITDEPGFADWYKRQKIRFEVAQQNKMMFCISQEGQAITGSINGSRVDIVHKAIVCDISGTQPGKDNSADIYTLMNALEHIPAQKRFSLYGEVRRQLKDNGLLLLIQPISSPWDMMKYCMMKTFDALPRGPVDPESVEGVLGHNKDQGDSFWRIVFLDKTNGLYSFRPNAGRLIRQNVPDPRKSASLIELLNKTPFTVDNRGDAAHKVWFSPKSLIAELSAAGFDLCPEGEDYYIFGSTTSVFRSEAGFRLQSLMPFPLKKIFAHGGIYLFKKRS